MNKFKVGDRVNVYGICIYNLGEWREFSCLKGTIYAIKRYEIKNLMSHLVNFDNGLREWVHPKQCRKLVKKKKSVTCEFCRDTWRKGKLCSCWVFRQAVTLSV